MCPKNIKCSQMKKIKHILKFSICLILEEIAFCHMPCKNAISSSQIKQIRSLSSTKRLSKIIENSRVNMEANSVEFSR